MKRDGKSCYFQLIGNQGFDQFFGGPHMLLNGVLMLPNTKIDQNLHPKRKRQTHWCAKRVLGIEVERVLLLALTLSLKNALKIARDYGPFVCWKVNSGESEFLESEF